MMERITRRKYLAQKIGDRCVICNRKGNRISYHNIYNKEHPNLMRCSKIEFDKIDLSEFVALCSFHHGLIHMVFRTKKVNMDNLVILLRILGKALHKDVNNGYTLFEDGGF